MQYTKNQIHDGLVNASNRYPKLKSHFDVFANSVISQLTNATFPIKGFEVEAVLDDSYFIVRFAGRDFVIAFESIADQVGQPLNGYINFYLEGMYPSDELELLRKVKFDGQGRTDLKSNEYPNDPVVITDDSDALFLVLELVYKSLEK